MCMYCDSIRQGKSVEVNVRSTMAVDNLCEAVANNDCVRCGECDTYFSIGPYKVGPVYYTSIKFYQRVKGETEVIVSPFSEGIPVLYCQFCGSKLSEDTDIDLNDIHSMEFDDEIVFNQYNEDVLGTTE